ncbi:hypothetical protein SmJEL517_g05880 [Synchytrium microbalum]|uniref:Small monomeric GTPase n=1 Tax=Synchytrium microbalum TaxID=1806994 RepID=A0A507BXX6_9FUNG|nr:uncharacterized protein SmJEL517_g05880 [Synchytrium microbalum]TPX30576.1 hypothetical protein SmJEL517_g05880 [Synchytrium microbalum]
MDRETGQLPRVVPTTSSIKRIKVLSLGDAGVGKSCLIKRYCEGKFVSEYIPTIGIDYGVKSATVEEEEVKVNFWDVAGDPVYYEVRNEFYKDTNVASAAAVLVFEVGSKKSFQSLEKWVQELRSLCDENIAVFLVANKIDVPAREVPISDSQDYAASNNFRYFEVSALTGYQVNELFGAVFRTALSTIPP